MKRAIVAAVCLALLLPVLAVCASAGTLYTFYPYEPVALYGDISDFLPSLDGGDYFYYVGILPEGKYKATFFASYGGSSFRAVTADNGYFVSSDGFIGSGYLDLYVDDVFMESVFADFELAFLDNAYTVFGVSFNGEPVDVSMFTHVQFELLDDFISLTDYVTAESMDAILDEVVALIPVVLTVIVGYIGIRKAISWLQGVLHNS